ncbi:pyrroloquinoline quinone biosynthesis protein PqqB [Roseomonas sp. M0104]|uniref:Coenzyme PQQ synthesis protein B n=1 Tax=Teichococcus coralli TaxID=2545983 RepID=A0A845BAH8_9PROT|nr:pyrroloquinoline quinone biosynthesis protein PqqB [Pseudoroseomonas coralli]MXP63618.1 pyrroloquinoline quinone biosynthesis protein PqqB [Pseudoroseomonas coralli]
MRFIILGSAAGGGFPQWNCACLHCRLAREGEPRLRPRTQSSLAVEMAGGGWLLVNASPDILRQVAATPALHPRHGPRDSPIAAVLLTSGEVDHVAGLLSLRERQPFTLRATPRILHLLDRNAIFGALDRHIVRREALALEKEWALPGLRLRLFAVPGKAPLYMEHEAGAAEDTVAVEFTSPEGRRAYYIPGCHQVTPELRSRIEGAALLLFDGTVWTDDELSAAGVGEKTGRRMGHQPLSGTDGSLAALAWLGVGRRVLVHINNTNPLLMEGSEARQHAEAAGWEVAEDGMDLAW